jgi:hypothetical protein
MSTCKAEVFAVRPLHWWEIAATPGATALPFEGFFAEVVKAAESWTPNGDAASGPAGVALCMVAPEGSHDRTPGPGWGEHESLIEEWFDAGEALARSELELPIEEPDRWERAAQWLLSLASAVGLRPV